MGEAVIIGLAVTKWRLPKIGIRENSGPGIEGGLGRRPNRS
jgi:hypothetical protein